LLEWLAILVCVVGTTLLGLTLVPSDYTDVDVGWLQTKVACVLVMVVLVLMLLELLASRAKQAQQTRIVELITGTQAGLCIGAGNSGLGSGLQVISVADGPARMLAVVFCAFGLAFTSAHPVFANRGYKTGRVVIITAYMALVSLAAGVVMGVAVLNEPWPTDPSQSFIRMAALSTIATSILLLNGQEWFGCGPINRGLYSMM